MIKNLNVGLDTSEMDLEAGSLTTSLSSMMPGCPLRALSILISLLILLFLTGLSTLMTTFLSSATEIPMYTSEYFPFPILVMISYFSISLNRSPRTHTLFNRPHSCSMTHPYAC